MSGQAGSADGINCTPPTETFGSLRSSLAHVQSFWDMRHTGNVVMLHYQDLRSDLEGEMRRLAAQLGIETPEELWCYDERVASLVAPDLAAWVHRS